MGEKNDGRARIDRMVEHQRNAARDEGRKFDPESARQVAVTAQRRSEGERIPYNPDKTRR